MKNSKKTNAGFTLIEVVISFALAGILFLMVGGAVTSTYQTATILQKLPSVYFSGQEAMENKLDYLEKKLERKYIIEKTLNDPDLSDDERNALNSELAEIESAISTSDGDDEKVQTGTVELFDKEVTIYKIKKSVAKENGNVTLYSGTASGVMFERPVPVIESVKVIIEGRPSAAEYFNAVGSKAIADVTYSSVNSAYLAYTKYEWYVSTGNQCTVPYGDGMQGVPESQLGNMIPVYPADFAPITENGNEQSFKVTDAYKGKFLLCVATPVSKDNKMGQPVASNMIYIYDLPVIDGNGGSITYRCDINPSLLTLNYGNKNTYNSDIYYEYLNQNLLDCTSAVQYDPNNDNIYDPIYFYRLPESNIPYIVLDSNCRQDTGDTSLNLINNSDTKVRFIRFPFTLYMSGPDTEYTKSKDTDVVFAVVKPFENATVKNTILRAGSEEGGANYGFGTNSTRYGSIYNDTWMLLVMSVEENDYNYILGITPFDLAQLIIIEGNEDAAKRAVQIETITNYLLEKYNIPNEAHIVG